MNAGETRCQEDQRTASQKNIFHRLKQDVSKKVGKVKFWAELIALLALIAYTCETRRINNLTQNALTQSKVQFTQSQLTSKQQFDEAQTASLKQFVTDQRPYLWITNDLGPFVTAPDSPGNTSGKLAYNFHVVNFGKSPAIRVQTMGRILFGKGAESSIAWKPLDPENGSIIPPGKDVLNSAWSDHPMTDSGLITRMQTAGVIEHVTVAGHIQYFDTSGNMYVSEFCLERNPSVSIAFCKTHNSIK